MTRPRPGFTMIELVAVILLISVLIALLLPAVQSSREAARRTQCMNNLMQLGLATRSYETTFRVLPPGTVDRSGPVIETPTAYQFGWIAQLLPYLEQKNISRRLDFNQGIYRPANLTARGVTMSVLLCPSEARKGTAFSGSSGFDDPAPSSYAACHHDTEAPIDADNTGVFFLNSHVRYDEIEDGLSHTFFFGEKLSGGDELGWASGSRATLRNTGTPINRTNLDPFDMSPFLPLMPGEQPEEPGVPGVGDPSGAAGGGQPDPPPSKGPSPITVGGFGSRHSQGANFCFGDGSVRFIRVTISDRVFRLLGARADGAAIGDDEF
jgi:prepilin-type N-terminal cleavage/methylation domain-containing protein/prepilin-type processing-associated H-X9-DG protein